MGGVGRFTEKAFRAGHPVHGNIHADIYVDAIFGTRLTRPGGRSGQSPAASGRIWRGQLPEAGHPVDTAGPVRRLGKENADRGWAVPEAALTVTFDSPRSDISSATVPSAAAGSASRTSASHWRELRPGPTGQAGHMVIRRRRSPAPPENGGRPTERDVPLVPGLSESRRSDPNLLRSSYVC